MTASTASFDLAKRDMGSLDPETPPGIYWGQGTPDGDASPWKDYQKGSLWIQVNATDDYPHIYQKVDEGSDDDDWVLMPVNKNLDVLQLGATTTAALALGGGTATTPLTTSSANKNFVGIWTSSTATSGDSRGMYIRHYFKGAGAAGDAIRAYGTVDGVTAAVGGTVNGIHATLSINASSAVSGAGNAIRATLDAATASRTLGGTCAALQLDSNIGANNTVPASWSFVRVTDTSSVKIPYLFNLPAASAGTIFSAHTTDAITHSIKCITDAGTVFYIMCTTTASNRA